jgi:hypothetical protein
VKLAAAIARSLQADMRAELRDLERAVAAGTRDASRGLRTELRRQVASAGLGQRLANSWRDKHHPNRKLDAARCGSLIAADSARDFLAVMRDPAGSVVLSAVSTRLPHHGVQDVTPQCNRRGPLRRTAASASAGSPTPSSRQGRLSSCGQVGSAVTASSDRRRYLTARPMERRAVEPDPVHDYRQLARDCDTCLVDPDSLGKPGAPRLQGGPLAHA